MSSAKTSVTAVKDIPKIEESTMTTQQMCPWYLVPEQLLHRKKSNSEVVWYQH
jgi:hypothetical protein